MARDKYHNHVKAALRKEGWTITHDPLLVQAGRRKIQVDLAAERLIGAERDNQKIAVEVKSFVGISALQDFYNALGQFTFYVYALEQKMPERELFLAIPDDAYESFFEEGFIMGLIERQRVKLFVYQTATAEILRWIK